YLERYYISETSFNGSEKNRQLLIDPSRGSLDQSRRFLTHPFTVAGERWKTVTDSWNICMSTQTSANLLFWIEKHTEMWQGPISVSVYTPDVDYTIAVKIISFLQTCIPAVRQRVSFHFSYPHKLPPVYVTDDDKNDLEYDCESIESVNEALVDKYRTYRLREILRKQPYPQNILRNIARKGCPNEYTFTPDVDMLLTPGMSDEINDFVSLNSTQSCTKCAFVIPTYEIHAIVKTNPANKNELRKLVKQSKARGFHSRVYQPNQGNSNLPRWESQNMDKKLDIMYNITSWKKSWEPIYIAKADIPLYDERFIGYGFTRSSQVYEMHIADYTWHMLNNAFLCHRGFQTSKKKDTLRRMQINQNSRRYPMFLKEVYARYNKSAEEYEKKTKVHSILNKYLEEIPENKYSPKTRHPKEKNLLKI
ncbi:Beta-1,4-glucuronyltransferase 1, partial [Halocaridina rubra]